MNWQFPPLATGETSGTKSNLSLTKSTEEAKTRAVVLESSAESLLDELAPDEISAEAKSPEIVYDIFLNDSEIGNEGDKHTDSPFFARFAEIIESVRRKQDHVLATKLLQLDDFMREMVQLSWPGQISTRVARHFDVTGNLNDIERHVSARVDSEVLAATRAAAEAFTKLEDPTAVLYHATAKALENELLPKCSRPDVAPSVQAVIELFYVGSCEQWLMRIPRNIRPEVAALLAILSDAATRSGDIFFAEAMRELSVIARATN